MRRITLPIALLAAAAVPMTTACGAFSGTSAGSYENLLLNSTYYGAYHRPLADEPRQREERDSAPPVLVASNDDTRLPPATLVEEPQTETASHRSEPVPAPPLPEASPDGTYEPGNAAGYVRAVYDLNETEVGDPDGTIVDMYRFAQENGTIYHSTRPAVGDIVFFHNTFDRNQDGRANDWYTHVGIVEMVDEGATVSVLSYVDGRVARTYMNLEAPTDEEIDGGTVNSQLRRPRNDDPPYTEYLAGELFAGFGSLLGNRTEVLVIDDWQPSQGALASR